MCPTMMATQRNTTAPIASTANGVAMPDANYAWQTKKPPAEGNVRREGRDGRHWTVDCRERADRLRKID
jgi:hypothetical protein